MEEDANAMDPLGIGSGYHDKRGVGLGLMRHPSPVLGFVLI